MEAGHTLIPTKPPDHRQEPVAFCIIGKIAGSVSLYQLREKDAVALSANLGEDIGRGMCRVGNELEALLSRQPPDGRGILNVVPNEVVLCITRVDSLFHAAPTKLEGDDPRNMMTTHQGIGNSEEILGLKEEVH